MVGMGEAGMDRTGSECIATERTDEDWQDWSAMDRKEKDCQGLAGLTGYGVRWKVEESTGSDRQD